MECRNVAIHSTIPNEDTRPVLTFNRTKSGQLLEPHTAIESIDFSSVLSLCSTICFSVVSWILCCDAFAPHLEAHMVPGPSHAPRPGHKGAQIRDLHTPVSNTHCLSKTRLILQIPVLGAPLYLGMFLIEETKHPIPLEAHFSSLTVDFEPWKFRIVATTADANAALSIFEVRTSGELYVSVSVDSPHIREGERRRANESMAHAHL